jgi:hypothetical protein
MSTTTKDKDTPGKKSNGNTPTQQNGSQSQFEMCQSNNLGSSARSSAMMGQLVVGQPPGKQSGQKQLVQKP